MKSLIRKMAKGQGGFTLVELLVVVAILGVIAAVAVLAVTKFIGKGTLEAAQTELHQAQTAITAAMADAGTSILNISGPTDWFGQEGIIIAVGANTTHDAAEYVYGTFNAIYEVQPAGDITDGDPNLWGTGIRWSPTEGGWEYTP